MGFFSNPECLLRSAHATCSDLERYRQFFGIVSDQELKEEADALKEKGDFTSPDSFKVRILPACSIHRAATRPW